METTSHILKLVYVYKVEWNVKVGIFGTDFQINTQKHEKKNEREIERKWEEREKK